jgi:hypothetical protein
MSIILRENEKLVKVVHMHAINVFRAFLTWPWIVLALLLIRYLANFNFFGYWNFVILIAALIVAVIVFYKYYIWKANALIITDQRVIEHQQWGFFTKTVTELLYNDILQISYSKEGMSATFYNYGDLIIRTASNNQIIFEMIPGPDRIVSLINSIRQEKRSSGNISNINPIPVEPNQPE